ncbi:hypothetical protein [Streptomyces sp. NPDC093225]|uniref:hypothetical protein n=1 Tax=Streptomyces sp. NPDC093225 TaxID=3366034 RepID=UPI003803D9BD
MRVVVYDTGMLIGLVGKERRAQALHKGFVAAGAHPPVVPGPALAQAYRTSPSTAYLWKRLLADSFVFPAPRTPPDERVPLHCLPCSAGFGTGDWQLLGDVIGSAALPQKKRADPVDALAVLIAAKHGGGSVLTSDRGDIEAYAAALPGCDVTAVPV